MKRKLVVTAALASLLAIGSSAIYAMGDHCDGGPHGHGGGGFGSMGAIYQLDDLTPDQLKQLHALQIKQRKEMEQTRNERESLRKSMREANDPKTVRPLAEKEGKMVTESIMRHAEFRADVDKILTATQRTKLKEMRDDWDKRRDDRGDDRRDGHGPGSRW